MHSRVRGRPAASPQPWDSSPVPPWSPPRPRRVRPPPTANMGLSPSSALCGAAEEEGTGPGGRSPHTTAVGPKLPLEGLGVRRQIRARPPAAAATCFPQALTGLAHGAACQVAAHPCGGRARVCVSDRRAAPCPVLVTGAGLVRVCTPVPPPSSHPCELLGRRHPFPEEGAEA